MDEPTNDLDIETLELLEELLANYQGTLLLVSHDRAFLDNVVTSTLVFEGNGKISDYIGGYQDYLHQREVTIQKKSVPIVQETKKAVVKNLKKLSFKEQRELDELPKKIERLESEQAALQQQLADPESYKQGKEAVAQLAQRLKTVEMEITQAYQRWDDFL